jgi:hypothetical protein
MWITFCSYILTGDIVRFFCAYQSHREPVCLRLKITTDCFGRKGELAILGRQEHVRGQQGYLGLVGTLRTCERTAEVPRTSWDI